MVGAGGATVGAIGLMSVLVFAPPQPDLRLQQREVAAIVNAFERPLLAHDEDELRHAIERATGDGEDIEGFWFIGHSGPAGIVADGQMLAPAVIGQYLSVAGVQWSYFSSCESAAFIEQVQAIYAHDAYAYIVEIADYPAWRTAALVAANYSNVGDIYQAVRAAAPANSTPLRFFPSGMDLVGGKMGLKEVEQVTELNHQLQELSRALSGDPLSVQPGLITTVRSLQRDVEGLRWWLRLNAVGWVVNGLAWLYVLSHLWSAR